MPTTQKFFLTTPIYYVNARPHIGHAYSTIVADVLARRHRLLGDHTWFLTGTDEHGQKIERSAAAAGIPPQQFADQVSKQFRDLWDRMGLTYDDYIRTTSDKHKRGVQKLFSELHARGQIYLSSYTGQYSIGEEMFVEGPPGTIGPDGRPTETVTEENFFFRLSDFQLPLLDLIESNQFVITPESSRNEVLSFIRGPVPSTTKSSETTQPETIQPETTEPGAPSIAPDASDPGTPSSAMGGTPDSVLPPLAYTAKGTPYLPGALRDLSVSRSSFTWGIPVPEPAASESTQKHVIYVWLDALANYMTAVGYGSESEADKAQFEKYWPADVHLVGKEITRFHCVYWPAFLMAAGIPTPKAVTANGWLLFDNSKMSKSKGNVVRTETILEGFGTLCPPPPSTVALSPTEEGKGTPSGVPPTGAAAPQDLGAQAPAEPTRADRDLFAADILRYHLLREIPFGQDGSFSFDAMVTRYNADLANGYGNLVSRTLNLIAQNLGSAIPDPVQPWIFAEPEQSDSADQISATPRLIDTLLETASTSGFYDTYRFDLLAQTISARIKIVDVYLSSHAPWKLAKSAEPLDRSKMIEVLYTAAESIRIITALLYPILPFATAKVWAQLGLGDIELAAKTGQLSNLQWGGLAPGTKLGPLSPIFPRADKGLAQIMANIEESNQKPPVSRLIDESNSAPAAPAEPHHPAAGPRTLADPASNVAGSAAITTERPGTPSHTEAPASGIFANQPPEAPAGPADASPQITIDDFAKVELRVAQILVAERIPKADKLLRLEVDLGYEKRQILSGIAEWYTPEDLIGRRIVVITNLAPRKMRGLESHGMLLAASHGDHGKPVLATFGEEIALGSRLK